MPASGGCWTCKDRRIRCDGGEPECRRCIKSKRRCQRYGLRLSWPKSNDTKRSLTGIRARYPTDTKRGDLVFLNTRFEDIEVHQHLSRLIGKTEHSSDYRKLTYSSGMPKPVNWKPLQLESSEKDLLAYFESVAFNSLSTLSLGRFPLRSSLLRLALLDDAPSSKAVLQSLLVFASLDRHGPQNQAMRLKASALHFLESSANNGLAGAERIHHIAAGMLLCSSEIHCMYDSATQWCWLLCGAHSLMASIGADGGTNDSDVNMIFNWLMYHLVFTRFSQFHWSRGTSNGNYNKPMGGTIGEPPVCSRARPKGIPASSPEVLKVLHSLFESILRPSDPLYHSEEYAKSLQDLESRIHNIRSPVEEDYGKEDGTRRLVQDSVLELYQLAALIYLERVSGRFSGQSAKLTSYAERAFTILSDMSTCELPFPLFIFGCEAQSDERRMMILDMLQQNARRQSLKGVRRMLQTIWAQDDLETDHELDYLVKLDVVLGANSILPAFA